MLFLCLKSMWYLIVLTGRPALQNEQMKLRFLCKGRFFESFKIFFLQQKLCEMWYTIY